MNYKVEAEKLHTKVTLLEKAVAFGDVATRGMPMIKVSKRIASKVCEMLRKLRISFGIWSVTSRHLILRKSRPRYMTDDVMLKWRPQCQCTKKPLTCGRSQEGN